MDAHNEITGPGKKSYAVFLDRYNADGKQCLSVGSGMWLGKEGPLVHVACCCAYVLTKLFPTVNDNEGELFILFFVSFSEL